MEEVEHPEGVPSAGEGERTQEFECGLDSQLPCLYCYHSMVKISEEDHLDARKAVQEGDKNINISITRTEKNKNYKYRTNQYYCNCLHLQMRINPETEHVGN